MQFFKQGIYIDFMRFRRHNLTLSLALFLVSLAMIWVPGPNFGIDFAGGTEVQLAFSAPTQAEEVRSALIALGYKSPEVVSVEASPNEYMIRVQETSALNAQEVQAVRDKVKASSAAAQVSLEELKLSPGGDKASLKFDRGVEVSQVKEFLTHAGLKVHQVTEFGTSAEHRYEAQLFGVADRLIAGLQGKLGSKVPTTPRRVEWVGPKAGAQLRDAALKSLLYAVAFIMVYVAFRFDLRFAPGGVVAMLHDAVITMGIFIALRKELNLAFVAAILTVVGYSINDTIVVYDRVRENMARLRDTSMSEIVNISTSETLSRTLITGGTTLLSLGAFFVWGTPVIKDFSLALMIGILVGTYSSIYVAAPITEWIDRKFFHTA